MPVKIANSSEETYDFSCLRRRFRDDTATDRWSLALPNTTSDDEMLSEDELDLRDLKAAIATSSHTISYEDFRKQLGLR